MRTYHVPMNVPKTSDNVGYISIFFYHFVQQSGQKFSPGRELKE